MRYSFHGKVRASGQQVDGYVEAETSTEAIDRLADQGIIGVYSVRAEPKQPRQPVLVAGTPEFDRAQFDDAAGVTAGGGKKSRRGLPAPPLSVPYLPPVPLPAVPPPAAPAEALPLPAPVAGVSDGVMLQLVEKLGLLVEKMQVFLDRPAQVVYASGPAREGKGGGKRGGASRNISDAQNSTLKDIFQNNLDLRRSLQKLSDTVAPAVNGTPAEAGQAVAEAPAIDGVAEADAGPLMAGGASPDEVDQPHEAEASGPSDMIDVEAVAPSEPVGDDAGEPIHAFDDDHARRAQPAA